MSIRNQKTLINEIDRMLSIANFGLTKPSVDKIIVIKKLIKEDFTNTVYDVFLDKTADQSLEDLSTSGTKQPLTLELKAAMLSHSLSVYQASLLGVYTEWRSHTAGAKEDSNKGTIFPKSPEEKLPDLSKERDRIMQFGKDPNKHKPHVSWDKEFMDIIKSQRTIVSWSGGEPKTKEMSNEDRAQTSKWLASKSYNLISYSGNRLTALGKAQIEFLARAYTGKPLDEQEELLFKILGDNGKHYATIAQEILRQFYSLALVPYIMILTKRAKYNANDIQLHEFIEEGVDHALYQMKYKNMFDSSRGTVGTFIITTVKNSVKDQLFDIADYELHVPAAAEFLENTPPPYKFLSTCDPKMVKEKNYDSVSVYKQGGKDYRGKNVLTIYRYVYNDPMKVLNDLQYDGRWEGNNKKKSADLDSDIDDSEEKNISPLSERYLTAESKQMFFNSNPPKYDNIVDTMGWDTENNGYDTFGIFQGLETLPDDAKKQIDEIFNKIIKLWWHGEQDYSKIDNERELASTKAIKNIMSLSKNITIFKTIMYEVFNFGALVEVYTRTWPVTGKNGGVTPSPVGSKVKMIKNQDGSTGYMPDINGKLPNPKTDTIRIWQTRRGLNDIIKPEFKNMIINTLKTVVPTDSKEYIYLNIDAQNIINKMIRSLRYYFGYNGANNPYIRQNMNDLNTILHNYSAAALSNQGWSQIKRSDTK